MAKVNGMPTSIRSGIPKLPDTPAGWERTKLKKYLYEIKRPIALEPARIYRLLTVKRSRGGVEERSNLLGSEIKTPSQFLVEAGDFLISKRQIVHGACCIVPIDLDGSVVSNEYTVIGTTGGIDLDFLRYLSESMYFQQTCFHSSIGVHVEKMIFNVDRWLNWYFNVPPLPEQKKIIGILTSYDQSISTLDKMINNSKSHKIALMQQLITGRIRLEGFNGAWKEVNLGDLGSTYTGLSGKSKEDFGHGSPFIPYVNIFNNSRVDVKNLDKVKVGVKEKQNLCKYGDIFFTTSSETPEEVGMASVLLDNIDKLYLNSFCFGYRLNNFTILHPNYARYLLRAGAVRRELNELAQGSTRFNISKKGLMKIKLTIPPIDEQLAISSIIENSESQVSLLEKQLAYLKQEKNSLAYQLFTGKRRVKVNDAPIHEALA